MTLQEYRFLQAEKGAIERMLEEIPEEQVIDRLGLESRKDEIEAFLLTAPMANRGPVQVRLTFRGKPVAGSHGILAEFGAAAVGAFSRTVASIGAGMDRSLGSRGQLPNQDDFRLLITGTALGSFGFELEEAMQEDLSLFPLESPVKLALAKTRTVMRATLGSDDELTEALGDVDPRAIDALRKFLEDMANAGAVFALEVDDEVFHFSDLDQLRRSTDRLRLDNIHEDEQTLVGRFLGVLPKRRAFEFEVAETQEIVSGKVGNNIEDPTEINTLIDTRVAVMVHSRRVGTGRPSYALVGWSPQDRAEAAASGPNGDHE